jgi:hypothetical protein
VRRSPVGWLVACGTLLVAAIVLGTAFMVGQFRERAPDTKQGKRSSTAGGLLAAEEVAALFPPGARVTPRWVRDHIPESIKEGRKRLWFEEEVWSFLRSRRDVP